MNNNETQKIEAAALTNEAAETATQKEKDMAVRARNLPWAVMDRMAKAKWTDNIKTKGGCEVTSNENPTSKVDAAEATILAEIARRGSSAATTTLTAADLAKAEAEATMATAMAAALAKTAMAHEVIERAKKTIAQVDARARPWAAWAKKAWATMAYWRPWR